MPALPTPLPPAGAGRRALAAACLAGVAGTHLADLRHHAAEAPYLAVAFAGLAAASLVLAVLLLMARGERLAWAAAIGLSLSALAGYVVSRTVGLPGVHHAGDWSEPAGMAAVAFEALLVVVALTRGAVGVPGMRAAAAGVATALLGVVVGGAVQQAQAGDAGGHVHAGGGDHRHGASASHGRGGAGTRHAEGPVITGAGHGRAHADARAGHGRRHAAPEDDRGHRHDPRRGVGHLQMTPSGRPRFAMEHLDVDATTAAERWAAAALARRSRAVARRRFPTVAAALRLGYAIDPVRPLGDRSILRPHLTNHALVRDGEALDPERPESLVYQRRPGGRLELVAFMFRAPAGPFRPGPEGRFIRWHLHGGCVRTASYRRGIVTRDDRCPRGRVLRHGDTMMVHVWLTDDLRAAFASIPPRHLRTPPG